MKNYLIAARYAEGLGASIADGGDLERAVDALAAVCEVYESVQDIHSALSNPAISLEQRLGVLRELLSKIDTPSEVGRLLEVMLRRGRIGLIPDVAAVLSELADRRLGRTRVQVSTALPMDPAQEERFAAQLRKYTGQDVRMECTVDPALLGGAVARFEDTVLDGSIRTRLDNMKKALLSEEQ